MSIYKIMTIDNGDITRMLLVYLKLNLGQDDNLYYKL